MVNKELDNKKAELAELIMNDINNEDALDLLKQYAKELIAQGNFHLPHISSDEELRSIIDQVLEDDKNGLFIDDEDLIKEMRTW
ncbi:MAG: hypothetical protein PHC95_07100 [Parabacteroides sp.]|nr:hypothetical protein [Parabacteroides sp.]